VIIRTATSVIKIRAVQRKGGSAMWSAVEPCINTNSFRKKQDRGFNDYSQPIGKKCGEMFHGKS